MPMYFPLVTPIGAKTYGKYIGSLRESTAEGNPEYVFLVSDKGTQGKELMKVVGGSVKFKDWMDAWRLHLKIVDECNVQPIVVFAMHGLEIQYRYYDAE